MENPVFSLARKAMSSLEMYSDFYASSSSYQEHFQEVLSIIRDTAENVYSDGESYSNKKFLLAFADALEVSNKSGEYIPLSK